MSYFTPLGGGELLCHYWDLVVLLQAKPAEIHQTWSGTLTIERGERVEALVWYIPRPAQLPTPDSAASHHHVWYVRPGQIYNAAATLTSKVRS